MLQIVHYPHPVLAHVSKPVKRIDAEVRAAVREMFELMYAAEGIGLAGNQVALPFRLFVLNLTGDPKQPDQEQVFINPVIHNRKGTAEAEEGCLSLPGVYAQVKRPETVTLEGFNLEGEPIEHVGIGGLFARAAQHELDHLDGTLFIDRLSPTERMSIREALEEFELDFVTRRRQGLVPDDAALAAEIRRLEGLQS